MHGSIRDRLEELLAAGLAGARRPELDEHLASCAECSSEVEAMRSHSELLRSLRAPEDVNPAPGFYARVLQRIEERAPESIWSVLADSVFAKRLVYASLTVAVALGTYVVTEESRDGHLRGERMVAQQFHYDAPIVGSQSQQRDAVLENFAVHQGAIQ